MHIYIYMCRNVNKLLICFGLIMLFLSGLSCGREQQVPVPYIYVNYTVYLNNPSNSHLRVPGSHLVISGQGNHGIFLYRLTLGDSDDFIAFDLTCTYEPLENCVLELNDSEFFLECPCCGSTFSIFDGYPATGPAKWPLKQYETTNTGNTLRIYN